MGVKYQQVAAQDGGAVGGCEAAAEGAGCAAGGGTSVPAFLLRPAGPNVCNGAAQQVTC